MNDENLLEKIGMLILFCIQIHLLNVATFIFIVLSSLIILSHADLAPTVAP